MKQLLIEHVKEFAPYQLFELEPPSGVLELWQLEEEDVDAAIEADRYRVKSLTNPKLPIATYDFQGLKGFLSSIKRYQPCWTNKW